MFTVKKRKISEKRQDKKIVKIVQPHNSLEKWLVEWSDRTRTWENKDKIGNLFYESPSYIN